MAGIGIGVVFLAYGFGLWGYCLLKDYDVNIYQLFRPEWPPPKYMSVGKALTPSAFQTLALPTGNNGAQNSAGIRPA